MSELKRKATTVYLDPQLARAAKIKAATTDKSLSDMVNESLARYLRSDADALAIFDKRKHEKRYDYEEFVAKLKKDGLL